MKRLHHEPLVMESHRSARSLSWKHFPDIDLRVCELHSVRTLAVAYPGHAILALFSPSALLLKLRPLGFVNCERPSEVRPKNECKCLFLLIYHALTHCSRSNGEMGSSVV